MVTMRGEGQLERFYAGVFRILKSRRVVFCLLSRSNVE